ncbi:MAG: ubiquinol-cytochrome c reductase iron-sulfur subunit [Actinomycetota bacterium]
MNDQPIWRRDFPYTSEGEDEVTRREFTKYLVFASAAFAGGGGLVSLWSSLRTIETGEPREIVPLDEVEVGGSYLFDYPGPNDPAILVRPEADILLGFSQKCTHLGCVVFWSADESVFECPCHEGFFNLEGRPIAGPPERPLARIELETRDGVVWATGRATGEHA